jgi:hypothetical protein
MDQPLVCQLRFKIELIHSFTCSHCSSTVCDIVPTDGGNAWILQDDRTNVCLVDTYGHVSATVNIWQPVDAMAADLSGGLYISCRNRKSIKYVSPRMDVQTLTTTTDYPRGLVYCKDRDSVLVCTASTASYDDARAADRGVGQLMYVSRDFKQTPFTTDAAYGYPLRVTINVNGDVCVCDAGNECVTVASRDGTMVAKYSGKPGSPFAPRGICCDGSGHIFVACNRTDRVHVLKPGGEFRCILDHATDLIKCIWSIAIDSAGRLWTGEDCGRVKVCDLSNT